MDINPSELTRKASDQSPCDLTKIDAQNKGWNADLEKLIVDIEDKSWAYTWMHNASVNYLSRWNDKLSIATIALNILTGTSTFATLNTCSTLLWVQISTGFVIYIGAFIAGYQKYHRLEERVEKHKQAASKYSALYHSIQAEIGLHSYERQKAKEFITWATDQYDNLLLSSPDVDDKILKMYFDLYKEDKRAQPVIYNYHQGPIVPIKDYKGTEGKGSNGLIKLKDSKRKTSSQPKVEPIEPVNRQESLLTGTEDKKIIKEKSKSRRKYRSVSPIDSRNKKEYPKKVSRIDTNDIERESVVRPNYISPPPPSDFREMKSQLLNRNTYTNYFHQYDDKLLKYQMERMNSLKSRSD